MTKDSAEYEALKVSVAADRRYRRFLYLLAAAMFILITCGLIALGNSISNKIDVLVEGSVARGNARQKEAKTIAKETERYNTCIFVIPIDERTPANQQKCFEAADLPGGLDRGDFTPIEIPALVSGKSTGSSTGTSVAPAQSSSTSSSSSPKPSTSTAPAQPDNPQPAQTRNPVQSILDVIRNVTSIF